MMKKARPWLQRTTILLHSTAAPSFRWAHFPHTSNPHPSDNTCVCTSSPAISLIDPGTQFDFAVPAQYTKRILMPGKVMQMIL